ncbi:AAA family ATPase [Streptomyces sp. NPDC031705]|uniref:AAA family ATPase n=1 Tax=Streptomyces sp. NPDC031705 TaxID=3155729 RepID=UPI00340ADF88
MPTTSLQDRAPTGSDALWERAEPLARAQALIRRTGSGTGGTVVIRGASGTGRTALLHAIARSTELQGTAVLRARCSVEETDVDFGAVLQLFDGVPHTPAAGPLAVDGECWGGSLHGDDLPSRLWSTLQAQAAAGPVLLAVDDVHLADAVSRRWLAQVTRRLDRLPVVLAVTERWQYDLVRPGPAFTDVSCRPSDEICLLAPLGPAAAALLVRSVLGDGVPRTLVEDCVRAGGGNPMLLHALLADLREITAGGALPGRLPGSCADLHPGAYTGAVLRWLDGAGPETADAVRTFAELQDEEDALGLLVAASDVDPSRVRGWTGELTRQGLLRQDRQDGPPVFAHPLLREAVGDSWDRHRRADVHRRAAELLHHRGDPEEAVVRHLLSIPAVGTPWAADALVGAAAKAVRGGRTQEAVAYLRRALQEPLTVVRRSEALIELGCLEVRDERASGVRHLAEALRLQRNAHGRVRAATALGTALVARGEVHTALDVLAELAEGFADSTDLAHAVQAATALISSHDGHSWLRVVAELRRADEQAPDGIAPTAKALLTEHGATAGRLSAAEVMERVRSLTRTPLDPLLEPYLYASAATLAQWADELAEADRLVARGLATHRTPQVLHPGHQSLLSVAAESKVMRGRYGALLADTSLWEVLPGNPAAPGTDSAHLRAQAIIALTETGRLAEARRLAYAVMAGGAHGSWEWNEFLYARGLLHMASEEYDAALADLLECGRRQSAREVESPIVTPWRSGAADCHVALGSPELAVPLAREELRLARVWGTPRAVGRALRALGAALGGRYGLELAEEAVELLRGHPEPLPELVPALLSLGQALQHSGQSRRARAVLREATERAERTGAVRLHVVAREALRDCGARPQRARHTGATALTSSELRIAQLAAAGHSNIEIAEMLHLAVRTVETHLTHCYRKLGIRRGDLAAALGDTGRPG